MVVWAVVAIIGRGSRYFACVDVLEILALDLMWLVNRRSSLRLESVCLVIALAFALAVALAIALAFALVVALAV